MSSSSYVFDDEDRITFNLKNQERLVGLVLHMGAKRNEDKNGSPVLPDDQGQVRWQSDIRGVVQFASLQESEAHETKLRRLISNWLAIPV